MSKFQYAARPDDAWQKRAVQSSSKFANVIKDEFQSFSAKKENWIRILPPTWPDAPHYGLDVWVHFSVGPDNGTVICLQKMKNTLCPICQAQARAEAQGRDDEAKQLKPTRRVVVWLIDRKLEAEKKDCLLVWTMPWTLDRDIAILCKDRISGELYKIDHPEAGYDITFNVEGERPNIKYVGVQINRRATTVDDKYLNFIVDNPITSVLLWRSYDEVKALFEGGMAEVTAPNVQPAVIAVSPAPPVITARPITAAVTPPPAVVAPPIEVAPPPPPPPPKPFVSEWTNTNCLTCGKPQYTISPTTATCENGHQVQIAGNGEAPPPPAIAAATPETGNSRASALRARFQTGGK